MLSKDTRCLKSVDGQKECIHCVGKCVKNGKAHGRQRYICKTCKRSFLGTYFYNAYKKETNKWIVSLLKEGSGIRSIARLLAISVNTVLSRILSIAKTVNKPAISLGKEYEVDELCTFVGKKTSRIWITYALRKDTKEVVAFSIGSRTNAVLRRVTDAIIVSRATRICTDKLPQYRTLIPVALHYTKRNSTNGIERKNLDLRTHLKRLSRRTICFSKSVKLLAASIWIYFWAGIV